MIHKETRRGWLKKGKRLSVAVLIVAAGLLIAGGVARARAYPLVAMDASSSTRSAGLESRAAISATRRLPIKPGGLDDLLIARLSRVCGVMSQEMTAGACAPEPPPPPTMVNGIPFDQIVVMSDTVKYNIRAIYARGQALGNNPRAFSKIGDSTIEQPYFLTQFDGGKYDLGQYAYLQTMIRYFAGSFARKSAAVKVSMHAWTVLNPMWADKTRCDPNESPVACELRLIKPVMVLIRLGANDVGTAKLFEQKMRQVLDTFIQQGVIPVLSTKPDVRKKAQDINGVMRQLAADYHIPLWDFDRLGPTMPGQGLGPDGVHLTGFPPHDYTKTEAFKRGASVQNLTAMIALDQVWRAATTGK